MYCFYGLVVDELHAHLGLFKKKASVYDQLVPQSHTDDQSMAFVQKNTIFCKQDWL